MCRYDRLHLHDIIDECHLPFLPMPDTFPTFPTRVQYGNYLQVTDGHCTGFHHEVVSSGS